MDILEEILLGYWFASFIFTFFLIVDAENLSIKNFISSLLVSVLLGWFLILIKTVIDLIRIIKDL